MRKSGRGGCAGGGGERGAMKVLVWRLVPAPSRQRCLTGPRPRPRPYPSSYSCTAAAFRVEKQAHSQVPTGGGALRRARRMAQTRSARALTTPHVLRASSFVMSCAVRAGAAKQVNGVAGVRVRHTAWAQAESPARLCSRQGCCKAAFAAATRVPNTGQGPPLSS